MLRSDYRTTSKTFFEFTEQESTLSIFFLVVGLLEFMEHHEQLAIWMFLSAVDDENLDKLTQALMKFLDDTYVHLKEDFKRLQAEIFIEMGLRSSQFGIEILNHSISGIDFILYSLLHPPEKSNGVYDDIDISIIFGN